MQNQISSLEHKDRENFKVISNMQHNMFDDEVSSGRRVSMMQSTPFEEIKSHSSSTKKRQVVFDQLESHDHETLSPESPSRDFKLSV